MKTNKLAIALIIAAALFTSCEKEIEFKGEQTDSKLVVNSLIEPGKPIKAYISKSYFFLDNDHSTAAPNDVVATLYVNGNRIGEMTPQLDTVWEGYEYVDLDSLMPVYKTVSVFYDPYCPNEGDEIKITASANGFDDVEATTSPLPNTAAWSIGNFKILKWEASYYEPYDENEDTVWYISGNGELSVEITDPNPGKTDYYKIYVAISVSGNTDYDTGNTLYVSTRYNDPIFGGTTVADIDIPSGPDGVFTDLLFDGRSYQIKLPLELYMSWSSNFLPDFFQVPIKMEHLTKEYYYYLNTCNQGDELSQFFAEPIQTYSNVEGGYGIVGGRTIDTLRFALPIEK